MNPSSQPLHFVELTGLQDDLLLPWLDLYETAFPPAERVLVSQHLLALKGAPVAGAPGEHHFLAALAGKATFAGLARYQVLPDINAAYLWYLATVPEVRNQGVGAMFYQEIVRRVTDQGVRVLVLEVETPAQAGEMEGGTAAAENPTGEAENPAVAAGGALALRRIGFYRRQGARLLEGIHYLQIVGRHQAPIPMHLMFHAFGALDATQAFALARSLWAEQVRQVGELRLA